MGRKRTTSCAQPHYGGQCAACHRVRQRRYRARRRRANTPETRSQADSAATRARAYVAEYLRRGAIALPGACERCGWEPSDVRGRHSPRLLPLHPDPAQKRQVAWLCRRCRTIVRSGGEALTMRWEWPGTAPQSPRRPILKRAYAEALAAVSGRFALAGLRAHAAAHELLARLAPAERERLYATLASARDTARPTGAAQSTRRCGLGRATSSASGAAILRVPASPSNFRLASRGKPGVRRPSSSPQARPKASARLQSPPIPKNSAGAAKPRCAGWKRPKPPPRPPMSACSPHWTNSACRPAPPSFRLEVPAHDECSFTLAIPSLRISFI